MPKTPRAPRSSAKRRKPTPDTTPDAGSAVLEEIYGEGQRHDDGASLQKIEQRSDRKLTKILMWVFIGLALVVGASAAGFYTFNRDQRFNERGVTLTIETGTSVPSGGETTLSFVIKNQESVGIKDVELTVTPPEGWTFKESSPEPADEAKTLWQLGTIGAGKSLTFTMTGVIVGEVGSVKTFNASVTYRPTNFNYNFTAETSGSVNIGSSILNVEIQGPTQVTPNASGTYVLTYTNASDEALSGIRFTATYPEGFTPTKQTPKARDGNNVWVVDELASGAKGTIEVVGTFSAAAGASLQLTFVADLRRDSTFEKQVESSIVVLVSDSTLTLELTANKQSKDSIAKPSDVIAYVLTYKNKSDAELQDIAVSVSISGGGFETNSFADDDGATFKDGKATWNAKLIPQLASVKPKASGTIRFSIKAAATPTATKGAGGPTISVQAAATTGANPLTKLEPLVTKLITTATLVIDPRYYRDDGTQVGAGPLPPQVGSTTTYRMYWRITNTTNELTGLTVSVKIPASVFWTGKNVSATAGSVAFDAATRIVTWTLNKLPTGVGIGSTPVSAAFDLSITPEAEQAGTSPVLVEAQTLKAKDSFTGTSIEVKKDQSTTDLPNDSRATGKGAVVTP